MLLYFSLVLLRLGEYMTKLLIKNKVLIMTQITRKRKKKKESK